MSAPSEGPTGSERAPGPAERRLREALLEPAATPRPAFRARLRAFFTDPERSADAGASREAPDARTGERDRTPAPRGRGSAPAFGPGALARPGAPSVATSRESTPAPERDERASPVLPLRADELALERALRLGPARASARSAARAAFLAAASTAQPAARPWAPVWRAWRWAGLAAAAAAVLWFTTRPEPALQWERLEGDVVAVADASWRGPVLEQTETATLRCGDGRGGLCLGDRVRVDLAEGTRAKFCPPRCGRDDVDVPVELLDGELWVHVDPSRGPVRLHVRTAEGIVHVTGTSLSVKRTAAGTCVCVAEGHVVIELPRSRDGGAGGSRTVGAAGARERVELGPNGSVFLFNDGREPLVQTRTPGELPVSAAHAAHAAALEDAVHRWRAQPRPSGR